jgi:hypothetical protein
MMAGNFTSAWQSDARPKVVTKPATKPKDHRQNDCCMPILQKSQKLGHLPKGLTAAATRLA